MGQFPSQVSFNLPHGEVFVEKDSACETSGGAMWKQVESIDPT